MLTDAELAGIEASAEELLGLSARLRTMQHGSLEYARALGQWQASADWAAAVTIPCLIAELRRLRALTARLTAP